MWRSVAAATPASVRRADVHAAIPVAHPLLASTARDVRELQVRLAHAVPDLVATQHGPGPRPPSLLAWLQQDLQDDATAPKGIRSLLAASISRISSPIQMASLGRTRFLRRIFRNLACLPKIETPHS